MSKEETALTIAKLFAKQMFYGEWVAECPNERVIEMLMKEIGLYPFINEDEMIKKTEVDESFYTNARDKFNQNEYENTTP